uniref:Osteopetrosis associated transmembrane protein n=1 Tax=Adineta vaga TaxID=104782 RepID=B5AHA0_ADIVA|nr:osteopetrosis associated transmembrane protein [Adineta vaga]
MWWKVLVFFLFIQLINENYSDPIYPIQNPCLAILDRLSYMSSDFLNCAVSRARPFKLCEGCVDNYARLQDLIGLLEQTYSDLDRKITCKQFLESYDSIQIVAQLIAFVQNIWSSSFCDNCITGYNDTNGTIHYSLTDSTTSFFRKKVAFDYCIFNATGRIVPIIPIDLNVTLNTNVCTVCLTSYNDINDLFLQLTQENKGGVCMDIVDTMNYTRLLWSKIYECRRHDPDYMAVMGLSFFIPTIVLVFYVSALFKGERQQKKLSRRKAYINFLCHLFIVLHLFILEKRLPVHSTNAALVGTRTWLWSNPND